MDCMRACLARRLPFSLCPPSALEARQFIGSAENDYLLCERTRLSPDLFYSQAPPSGEGGLFRGETGSVSLLCADTALK